MSIVRGDVVEVKLTRGLVAIIDAEDAERVCQHKWCAQPSGSTYYGHRRVGRTTVKLHRFIMDATNGTHLDHINGDGLDNRKSNLRFATKIQNRANSKKPIKSGGSTSVFKGVSWVKQCKRKKRWLARICVNSEQHVQYFMTELQAARAYDELARQYCGGFARTNFPQSTT